MVSVEKWRPRSFPNECFNKIYVWMHIDLSLSRCILITLVIISYVRVDIEYRIQNWKIESWTETQPKTIRRNVNRACQLKERLLADQIRMHPFIFLAFSQPMHSNILDDTLYKVFSVQKSLTIFVFHWKFKRANIVTELYLSFAQLFVYNTCYIRKCCILQVIILFFHGKYMDVVCTDDMSEWNYSL